jgi:hypothetical protein
MSGNLMATIQGFWSGPPLPPVSWACLRSFLAAGHRFTLYSYDPLPVPQGIVVKDACEILPRSSIFYFQNRLTQRSDIAPFADYFRLKLLAEQGGWYCDVDTVCLSSKLPIGARIWARQAPEHDASSVSNGQLYFEPGDPLVIELLRRCESKLSLWSKLLFSRIKNRNSLGPDLISSVLAEWGLPLDMCATTQTFYPIRWVEIFKLWLPEFIEEVEERLIGAVFLPLYQSFPLHLGLDPYKLPPKGSYLATLLDKFSPELGGARHTAAEVRVATRKWFKSQGPSEERWLNSIRDPNVLDKLLS